MAAVIVPSLTAAQDSSSVPYARAVATWISLIAAPGYERDAMEKVTSATTGWTRDHSGNLVKRVGDGSPKRVIACGLDETAYAVSAITEDGYLRVHVNGNGRQPELWDQFHEGQRVIVHTVDRVNPLRSRNIPGVFAVKSNHLWRRRVLDTSPASIENLWIDIGAKSRAEAERMGVEVLDPVVREWPEWIFADYVAGPAAGNRAGCAAVAAVGESNHRPGAGQTTFILSTRKSFSWSGLTGALARLGHVDSLYIVDAAVPSNAGARPVRAPWPALPGLDVSTTLEIGVPTRFSGTLVESVRESDLATLYSDVAHAAGLGGTVLPIRVAHGWAAVPPLVVRDSLSRFADVIGKLTDIYAVSGNEQPMRDAIKTALPRWARDSAVVDTAGNLVLAMGPNRDTTVFVAHMDEIGFLVTRIAPDGRVSLRTRGTFFPSLWEGQTALLHRAGDLIPSRDGKLGCGAARAGPLRGVFSPRDSTTQREPTTFTAWFGMDSAALVREGVTVGSPLTSYKCSTRLGGTRLTARSIDDRAGVTSLVLALDEIDPAKLDHKVVFVWSVREEGGLEGAKAATQNFGPSVNRAHPIDTFVSSDSPVESKRFAFAPIGQGAVIRALDNSSVTPPDEIDRTLKIARAAAIPLQYGVTNGGNDGSELARFGAVNVGLAWPLRYSHSPAEVIDLRDLRSLSRIVVALAKAPSIAHNQSRP
jgi:putative aminopeptidase FrvX